MADKDTRVQLLESDIPGAELPKPAEFCTVAILKRWLSCRGAKVSGNRKDLIKRLDYEPFKESKRVLLKERHYVCYERTQLKRNASQANGISNSAKRLGLLETLSSTTSTVIKLGNCANLPASSFTTAKSSIHENQTRKNGGPT